MKWREMTDEELAIFNRFIKFESVELTNRISFRRYARCQGERDKLVQFEPDLTFRLLRVTRIGDEGSPEGFHLSLYEPGVGLFMKTNDEGLTRLFGAEAEELLDSIALYAIRQHRRSETLPCDDELYGRF